VDPVALRFESHIAWIEFGDPATRNLLTIPLLDALPRALAEAEVRGARVAVLRGRGDLWSGGYDIGQIPPELFDPDPRAALEHPFERCMRAVESCPLPTVAAVNGHAIGGGLELAMSCDVRVVTAGAKLGIPAARLGLVYPHAGLAKLVRIAGPEAARLLLFTGDLVDAERAVELRLVSRSVPAAEFDAAIAALAARLADAAPIAVQGMKRVLRTVERDVPLTDAELDEILKLRARSYRSADAREGRDAFAAKRPPRFRGA
jgi:enoyl-CoA hydratase/carnithine racemase